MNCSLARHELWFCQVQHWWVCAVQHWQCFLGWRFRPPLELPVCAFIHWLLDLMYPLVLVASQASQIAIKGSVLSTSFKGPAVLPWQFQWPCTVLPGSWAFSALWLCDLSWQTLQSVIACFQGLEQVPNRQCHGANRSVFSRECTACPGSSDWQQPAVVGPPIKRRQRPPLPT